ncbi:MAG: pyridoxal-dependent decarboxylase [Desulfobacterales bacterium]|nr:pyridoxal-dependent decarboxylase [Desulfobacterales bacterium]
MTTIQDVRGLFTDEKGFDHKVLTFLKDYLTQIDAKKNGTMVGRQKDTDYRALIREARFHSQMLPETDVIKRIVALYEGVPLWEHPQTQTNVVPPPSAISVATAAASSRYNENSAWDRFGMSASQSEAISVGMLAHLMGYDTAKAGGIFTFGGTGCNLYGARLGIEKAIPGALSEGLTRPVAVFASDVSHYSIKTSALWTGIGMDNAISVATDDTNAMIPEALEEALDTAIRKGFSIGTIFATLGTTDAFGVDPIRRIAQIRDCFEQRVGHPIHLHADAVIGWPYLALENMDTLEASKDTADVISRFTPNLKSDLAAVLETIREVSCADSIGVDLHKTGWAPYLCSAFLVKDEADFSLLNREQEEMPYLFQGTGYRPGIFTLEASRPNYAQKGLANMLAMGREGYSALILHLLGVADHFREMIKLTPDIALLNRHNPAFVTDIRVYPQSKKTDDGAMLYAMELAGEVPPSFTQEVNLYNQRVGEELARRSQEEGRAIISYTECYRTTRSNLTMTALKSYPMSPFVSQRCMEYILEEIRSAQLAVAWETDAFIEEEHPAQKVRHINSRT